MRTNLLRVVFVFTALLMAGTPVFGQGGQVRGTVLDVNGEPVAGATIVFEHTQGRHPRTEQQTSDDGSFIQIGLRSGDYTVTASKDRVGEESANVAVIQGGRGRDLTFHLSPITGLSAADAEQLLLLQAAFNAGVVAQEAGDYDTAVAKFTETTTISPACTDCFVNLGHALVDTKEYTDAEAAFTKATELDDQSSDAFSGLALVYNAQKKYDLAQEAGAKATALSSIGGGGGSGQALYNQGVILWNAGSFAEAKEQFEAAIKADSTMPDAFYQLGMANLNLGLLPAAVEAFEGYLELAPDGPKAVEVQAAVNALKQ
jgi:Tfp pilus assembly protein PilF